MFQPQVLDLAPDRVEHLVRDVQTGHVKAALSHLESPLAGSTSEIDDRHGLVGRQVGLEVVPRQGVMPLPERIIVDMIVLVGDAIVVACDRLPSGLGHYASVDRAQSRVNPAASLPWNQLH